MSLSISTSPSLLDLLRDEVKLVVVLAVIVFTVVVAVVVLEDLAELFAELLVPIPAPLVAVGALVPSEKKYFLTQILHVKFLPHKYQHQKSKVWISL